MDVKLGDLIEKIKKEGIEEAQQTSDEMIIEAKQKAASIISQAKKEAEKIVQDGRKQSEQFKENSEADLQQSTRNAELLLKEKINSLFDKVFKRKVADTLTPDFLKEMILTIVTAWANNSSAEIVLKNDEKQKVEALLFSGINKELKESISLKASNDVTKGFRIGLKGEQVYYDFSDDAIAETLKSLINPNLKEILDQKNG